MKITTAAMLVADRGDQYKLIYMYNMWWWYHMQGGSCNGDHDPFGCECVAPRNWFFCYDVRYEYNCLVKGGPGATVAPPNVTPKENDGRFKA